VRQVRKVVSQSGYGGNSLGDELHEDKVVLDEKDAKWIPEVPGTIGELLLTWACTSAPARVKAPAAQ
jgi:restriction endonuclease